MKTKSFKTTKADRDIINKITQRASKRFGDTLSISMDITATHCNGNPLRLSDLLEADDFNFSHDIVGIYNHLDRNTGKLTGFFSPRFSAPK